MAYQHDIKQSGDEEFLISFNRHSDNYSSCDLTEEAKLMTVRIAYLLKYMDRSDKVTVDLGWEQIQKAIITKCKLIEVQAKLTSAVTAFAEQQRLNEERIKDLHFKQKLAAQKVMSLDDFKDSINRVTEILFQYVEAEKMPKILKELESVVSSASVV